MLLLRSLKDAPRDVKLLWISVFLRLLSYGLTNQVLTLFLKRVGLDEGRIGLFMSLTLVGDVVFSYILTWYADAIGRRRVLIFGSLMMLASGIIFAYSDNFYILLLFAVAGVISPSSDEVGPFKSIEEAVIAHLSPPNQRPEIYAIHGIAGTVAGALGAITSGGIVRSVRKAGWATTDLECYRFVFSVYALLALSKVGVMFSLSKAVELDIEHDQERITTDDQFTAADAAVDASTTNQENTPLISRNAAAESKRLSPETIPILAKLLVIFMTDSLGAGFMTSGWMVYYYRQVYGLSHWALGVLFFACQICMGISAVPSSTFARWFGPTKATLLVQIPSAIFSILIPLVEGSLGWSVVLLNIHFATTAMDVIPRQLLLTNLIPARDLTRVMGIVNIGKTFSRCIGPIFTGLLAGRGYLAFCFIISGSLIIIADCILAFWFLSLDSAILKSLNY